MNPTTTVSTPVLSVQNLITNPHSIAGWLGLVSSLSLWGTGLVGESVGAMVSDGITLALSLSAIVIPAVVKVK